MNPLPEEATESTDERNLGMAAGVLQVVRLLPGLTPEQRDAMRELNRKFLSRVTTVSPTAADDAFNIALMARTARPPAHSWAQSLVRRAVRDLELNFQDTISATPGIEVSPDLVFPDARVAVYVNECLWHSCSHHVASLGANGSAWTARIAATEARDVANTRALETAGWTVVRVWEHDDPRQSAEQIKAALTTAEISSGSGGDAGSL